MTTHAGKRPVLPLTLAALALAALGPGRTEIRAAGKRQAVGVCASAKATIFRRAPDSDAWKIVDQKEDLSAGDLLVGLPGAEIDSRYGHVRLLLLADLARNSPYPIRESAVRLLKSTPFLDLDFVLDRGRIDLINTRKKGAAHVRVHVRQDVWDLTLAEPGTSVALELYGRWPRGTTFTKTPGPKDVPTADLVFLVLKGEATLKHANHEFGLSAPPGPAMIEWDSVTGMDEAPSRLDKLPAWATEDQNAPIIKEKKARIKKIRQLVLTRPIKEVLRELMDSDDPQYRQFALVAMGAFDDLLDLARAMRSAKYPDVWQNGILVMRHWIGRGPGQDLALYNRIVKEGKVPPVHAETIVQLLHSFGEEELAEPETYQTLIDYLEHPVLGIRGLAYWHLERLVPQGKAFGYDPLAPQDKREAAIAKWRQLIPKHKLPPKANPQEKK